MRIISLVIFCLLAAHGMIWAQTSSDKGATAAAASVQDLPDPAAEVAQLEASVPSPRAEDVASIDAIVAAVYSSISGPSGARDWNRFKSLMLPEARLTASVMDAKGRNVVRLRNVDQYIERAQSYFSTNPFYEHALVNKVQRFGNIAHVFTSYASMKEPGGKPFDRGVNSMQLMYDGKRWWVLSILWDDERPGNRLPKSMGG